MAFSGAPNVFNLQAFVNILTNKADAQLKGLEKNAQQSGSKIEGSFAQVSRTLTRIAGPAVLGALGAAITAVAAQTVQLGIEMHDALSVFQRDLGITRDEARELGGTLEQLWQVNTDDVSGLTSALTAVRQQFGDLGDDTANVTQTILDFAKVTGTDAAQQTKFAAGVLRQYNLELSDLPQVLNSVVAVQQQTGASSEKLLQALAATAPVTQSLGLSLQETAAFMGLLERSGAGVEAANESLVMFLQSATAASEEQKNAFRTLGIELNAAGQPAAGVSAAFRDLMGQMERGEITGSKLTAALKLVGNEAGKKLVGALRTGAGGFDELTQAATDSAGTINAASQAVDQTLRERLTLAWREAFGEAATDGAEHIVQFLEWILGLLGDSVKALQDFGSWAGYVFTELEGVVAQATSGISDVFSAMGRDIIAAWQLIIERILEGIQALPGQLRGALGDVEQDLIRYRKRLIDIQEARPESVGTGAQKFADAATDFFTGGFLDRAGELFSAQIAEKGSRTKPPAPTSLEQTSEAPIKPSGGGLETDPAAEAEARKKAAEEAVKKEQNLLRLKQESLKITLETTKGEFAQARVKQEIVRLQARIDKLGEDDPKAKAQIEANAQAEIASIQAQAAEAQKKRLDEIREAKGVLHQETLRAQGKETEALLAALDQERASKMKAGQAKVDVDNWYAAQKAKIEADAADRTAQVEAQILDAKEQHQAAAIRNLERERDAAIRSGIDKAKAEELFQARKAQIEQQYKDQEAKAEGDLQAKILQNQAAVTKDSAKAAELQAKAENIAKLQAYRDQIKAAREAGVEEVVIQRYIASEKKRILEEEKQAKQQAETSADPRKSFDEAFKGLQQGLSFSIGGESSKLADPASKQAAKDLAAGLGSLASSPKKPEKPEAPEVAFTLRVEDGTGKTIISDTVTGGTEKDLTRPYQLGGFA